jgi:diguanylate cyclase (GGDEF)-like protein
MSSDTASLATTLDQPVRSSAEEMSFDRITRLASTVMQTKMAMISLIQDSGAPTLAAGPGVETFAAGQSLPFCHYAVASDTPLVVTDAQADPRFDHDPMVAGGPKLRFYLGVPLRTRDGATLGTLCTVDTEPRTPTADQIAMLSDLARMVVNEMELRQMSMTDSLTGALTKRGFEQRVEAERIRCQRNGYALTLVAIDLDHFKTINDRFGHATGDSMLRAVVDLCREKLRHCDVIGRTGGEEFVIMLPEMPGAVAAKVADRLRQAIADLRLPASGDIAQVTASVGVAMLSPGQQTMQQALLRADIALYAAKARGRNRVVLDPAML